MNIAVVDENKAPVIDSVESPKPDIVQPAQTEPFLVDSVAKMFDLKPSETSQYKSKINTLIDYAKTKVDEPTSDNIIWAIRNLGLKLGTPPLGEKLINYLTQYAFLELETRKLEDKKRRFEK